MKFKDYVTQVNSLLKKHPEIANFEVITSADDEGNEYNKVFYGPSIGKYDASDRQFTNDTDEKEYNAVCLN